MKSRRNGILGLAVCGVLIFPLLQVAVFTGSFKLTVCIENEDIAKVGTIVLATTCSEQLAAHAADTGSLSDWNTDPVQEALGGCQIIEVPFSGRSDVFGRTTSYAEYRHLLIGFEAIDGTPHCNHFTTPPGQGHRTINVVLSAD